MGIRDDQPARRHQGHIQGLDGMRGLAIGLVLFSHSVIYDEFSHLHAMGLEAGYAGVSIFFVLSGYLITTLLLREENRTGRIDLGLFYVRRSLRLFPALWLYLMVIFVIGHAGGLPNHPWHSLVAAFLYIRNLVGSGHETVHLWSLSVEAQFYLLWPFVFIGLRRNQLRLLVALGLWVGITGWRIYATQTGFTAAGALYMRSDFCFDAPLLGCIVALALHVFPWSLTWLNSTPRRSDQLAIGGGAILLLWVGMQLAKDTYPGTHSTGVSLIGVILMLSQIGIPGRWSRWLCWWPLVTLGQISYGVYLWQQLFLGPRISGFESIRSFPVGLLLTFAIATASYRGLEKPLLHLKDRKFHQRTPTAS